MINLLQQALKDWHLVQSFSGVRTQLGENTTIEAHHAALAEVYGYYYAKSISTKDAPVILARDPRPTGRALVQALVRGFLAAGVSNLIDLGIITTPLAQSAVRYFHASGGVIVTASHNPLCDNGWKFLTGMTGRTGNDAPEGALLAAERMEHIVACVALAGKYGDTELEQAISSVPPEAAFNALIKSGSRHVHNRAAEAYTGTIANDWGLDIDELRRRKLGPILLDPNGGAASGLNSGVLEDLGVQVYEMNAELSRPAHPIDTDSINPATGEHVLTRVARAVKGCGALFGVAFDYDADRGNVVLPGDSASAVVPPQTISALNVALTLSRWDAMGRGGTERWVVASDATSRRIEQIAGLFGVHVAWVETGEVNVVTRIRELANRGAEVPIGVEGANGGTVFAGSTCRDGVLTALSCALAVSGDPAANSWLGKTGRRDLPEDGLERLTRSLPYWFTPNDKVQLKPMLHSDVKSIMETAFVKDIWPGISGRYSGYKFANYEGTKPVEHRTGEHTGGWRIELERPGARPFIFARGSRTEAGIWRIAADSPDETEANTLMKIARKLAGIVGLASDV